jgi:hypothetical protein
MCDTFTGEHDGIKKADSSERQINIRLFLSILFVSSFQSGPMGGW